MPSLSRNGDQNKIVPCTLVISALTLQGTPKTAPRDQEKSAYRDQARPLTNVRARTQNSYKISKPSLCQLFPGPNGNFLAVLVTHLIFVRSQACTVTLWSALARPTTAANAKRVLTIESVMPRKRGGCALNQEIDCGRSSERNTTARQPI